MTALADERFATVTIEDNGSGSRPIFCRIFSICRARPATLDRAHGGLGIGLLLVEKLVELRGGSIDVASPGPGRGATVSIRLPLCQAPEVSALHDEPSVGSFACGARFAACVDRRRQQGRRRLTRTALRGRGYHVDVAYCASDALAKPKPSLWTQRCSTFGCPIRTAMNSPVRSA